jgi:hypothetical protein
MRDASDQPGNDDAGIDQATDEVVQNWRQAAPGKEPNAGAEDFARMREGFADIAAGDGDPAGEDSTGEAPARDEG